MINLTSANPVIVIEFEFISKGFDIYLSTVVATKLNLKLLKTTLPLFLVSQLKDFSEFFSDL